MEALVISVVVTVREKDAEVDKTLVASIGCVKSVGIPHALYAARVEGVGFLYAARLVV